MTNIRSGLKKKRSQRDKCRRYWSTRIYNFSLTDGSTWLVYSDIVNTRHYNNLKFPRDTWKHYWCNMMKIFPLHKGYQWEKYKIIQTLNWLVNTNWALEQMSNNERNKPIPNLNNEPNCEKNQYSSSHLSSI